MKPNLSYQYYKGYYEGFEKMELAGNKTLNGWLLDKNSRKTHAKDIETFFKKANKPFLDFRLTSSFNAIDTPHTIKLLTTYPGLLIGTGYTHGVGEVGEFKSGFYFDHTNGLPLIPGHSVKGVLRSVFPDFKDGIIELNDLKDKQPDENTKLINEVKAKWLAALIVEIDKGGFIEKQIEPIENLEVRDLEKIYRLQHEIFDGIRDINKEGAEDRYQSIYHRDIFYDAYPIKSSHTDERVLDSDSITPHIKMDKSYEESMLLNPVPLLMLKVLPNVEFQFNFRLHDGQILNKDQKKKLFTKILLTIGIGAKTNVGYGQFIEAADIPKIAHQTNAPRIDYTRSIEATRLMKINSKWEGVIDSSHRENSILIVNIGNEAIYLKKKTEKIKGGQPEIGAKIQIKMIQDATETTEAFEATIL